MATRVRDITNNKFKNAIRAAGWSQATEFYKDFNLPPSTLQSWAGGHRQTIFDIRTSSHLIFELCKIFDCSKDELNSMVCNAYRVKHGHPDEEPEKAPLGDKNATIDRYLAYDEKKKEENSNGEIPLEDFIKNENPDFFNEYPEIKAEVEDGKTVKEITEEHNIPETNIRPITKLMEEEYMWEQEPEVMRKKEIEVKMAEAEENTKSFKLSSEDYDLIEETMYGKISYRKFKRLMNCIKYYCM